MASAVVPARLIRVSIARPVLRPSVLFNRPQARASPVRSAFRPFSCSVRRNLRSFNYETLRPYSEELPENTVLVDVREPNEYAEGHIPNAINIPVKSQPDALLLPEDEFEDRFGFPKPPTDSETVFYCKAGVRSKAASQIAETAGYSNVGDYAGSWLDWTAKGGKVAR